MCDIAGEANDQLAFPHLRRVDRDQDLMTGPTTSSCGPAASLPSAVTVDIGWAVSADTGNQGWAVVEATLTKAAQ